jgi:NADH dehydrogenase FAD-containing subunit
MKNVVVVGLSWAGAKAAKELAKSLPATHRVIAICPYDYAYHTVGALRAAVQPGWETSTPVPLDRLLSGRHVVLRGLVTAVNGESIAVDRDTEGFGSQIPFDALVLATGARYGFPARPPKDVTSVDQALDLLRRFQGEVKAAKSVLIIGGGAVGVEFAGEGVCLPPVRLRGRS